MGELVRRLTNGSDFIPSVPEKDVLVYVKSDHSISIEKRKVIEGQYPRTAVTMYHPLINFQASREVTG